MGGVLRPFGEHANLTVRDIEGMIRFLQTAFPEFRVRSDKVGTAPDGSMGTDETYIALSPASTSRNLDTVPGLPA
jgi:hypothetical protein